MLIQSMLDKAAPLLEYSKVVTAKPKTNPQFAINK